MAQPDLRTVGGGFAAAGALFGAVDGYLIGEVNEAVAVGAVAGALIGAFIGLGVVLLAWKPRPQDGAVAVEHGPHPNYMAVWVALFVLTVVEVGVAFLALSQLTIILMLIVLALWKALMVALYYMHLKYEPRRMWVLAASPLPLALILVMTVLIEGW